MANSNYSAKNVIAQLNKDDVGTLVNKIINSENKMSVILDLCSFAYAFCEKIKEKNFEVYKNNVEPKLIRLDHIKTKLQTPGISEAQEQKYLTDLILVEKEIKEDGKDYNKSIVDKLAIGLGGVSVGVVAYAIIQKIFLKK